LRITIRREQPKDYRAVEELTREAFWGSMDHRTCDGEHLLVHKLRKQPCFVPELDFVAEAEGQLAGHIIYSRARVITAAGDEIEVLTFGPLSVLPEYKKKGVGSALMRHSITEAKILGYAIIIYGHPDYYPRFGFRPASAFGITSQDGRSFDALMALPLYDGALGGVTGRFVCDEVYNMDPQAVEEFDQTFPAKEPAVLPPITLLTAKLPERILRAFQRQEIKYVSQLQRYSGAEMLRWEGIDEPALVQINAALKEMGQPKKLLPTSCFLQLAEMGVRMPIAHKIREKAGIAVYKVQSEGKHCVLKVFEKAADRREIDNYKILASLGIPTLPMLKHTACALLLPDVENSPEYRLGCEEDLADLKVASALARWYRKLHGKGRAYLRQTDLALYDETDKITLANLDMVAHKTNTVANPLWQIIRQHFAEIRRRIAALPRTLTYNDFYWTNLVVARDRSEAMMLDFNLLGKGYVYGDLHNVTSALSPEAAAAFRREYGQVFREEEKEAHECLSPLVGLIVACERESFPQWALPALEELKNGAVQENLIQWLNSQNWLP
jgi:predicted N-acetyltransferase YhbS